MVRVEFPAKPRIVVIGAGALGCYYGARLAKAGEDVRFLVRSDRAALLARGLRVKTPTERIRVRTAEVHGAAAEIGPCDLVVVAMKATANEALRRLLPPLMHERTIVLTLQNGLGVEEPVAKIVGGERVLGAICYIASVRTAPGVIDCSFPGLVAFGEFGRPAVARTKRVAALFQRAGVKTQVHDNLDEQRWRKLVWNVPFNGLAIAAGGVTTDVILADAGLRTLARQLMEEVVRAAAKFGHVIPRSFVDLQIARTVLMPGYKPSSLLDWESGRPVEVEEIWGEPVRRAKAAGVAVPRMEMLHALIGRLVADGLRVRRRK